MSSSGRQKSPFSDLNPAMNEEARRAFTAASDAMSQWRDELTTIGERNSLRVFDKMGAAAKAMGWPGEFVDMTRSQLQQASKIQAQMIDQVMSVWEQQVKAPDVGVPNVFADQMKQFTEQMQNMGKAGGFPGMPGMGAMPGMPDFTKMMDMGNLSGMSMAPLQFWMQAADMWQKNWQQAVTSMMEAQAGMMGQSGGGGGRSGSSR
jgi:hypothetical protein